VDNAIVPCRAFLYCVFGQELRPGTLPPLLKAVSLAWQLDPTLLSLAAKSSPKHFKKEPLVLGPAAQQDLIVLDLVVTDPKHFKKGVESGRPARPIDYGSG